MLSEKDFNCVLFECYTRRDLNIYGYVYIYINGILKSTQGYCLRIALR